MTESSKVELGTYWLPPIPGDQSRYPIGFRPELSPIPDLLAWVKTFPEKDWISFSLVTREEFLKLFKNYCPNCLLSHDCMPSPVTHGVCMTCKFKNSQK